MPDHDPGKSSLSGLVGVMEIVRATIDQARADGLEELATRGQDLLDEAEHTPRLPPGDVDRKTIFSRLNLFQLDAMRAFELRRKQKADENK